MKPNEFYLMTPVINSGCGVCVAVCDAVTTLEQPAGGGG